jgi:hypothetical protein
MLTIRCSSTDRVMACASSLAPTDHPYTPNNDEAREGQAAHAALAVVVAGAEPDIEAVATEYQVDRDELARLVGRGRKTWSELHGWFPEAVPERHARADLGEVELTGTADVMSVRRDHHAAVLDWKAGWRPSEHPHQLMSYAYLAGSLAGEVTHVLGIEVWLRLGTFRVHRWTLDELAAYAVRLSEQLGHVGKQWGPSPSACQYCPLQLTCRARADYVEGGVAGLMPVAGDRYAVSREMIGALWEKRTALRRALDRFDAIADAMLDEGPIPIDEHRELRRVSSERTRVRFAEALPYLRSTFPLEEVADVVTVAKGRLMELIRSKAPHGKGAAYERAATAALEQIGALEPYIHTEKRVVTREEK